MELSSPKKFYVKRFYTLKTFLYFLKSPLGKTGCVSNLYYLYLLTGCSYIQFFNSPPLSPAKSVKTPLVPHHSLSSTCVTYRTP